MFHPRNPLLPADTWPHLAICNVLSQASHLTAKTALWSGWSCAAETLVQLVPWFSRAWFQILDVGHRTSPSFHHAAQPVRRKPLRNLCQGNQLWLLGRRWGREGALCVRSAQKSGPISRSRRAQCPVGILSGLQVVIVLYPHVVEREIISDHLSRVSAYTGADPSHDNPPPWPNYPQRPHSRIPSHWGLWLDHMNFGGHKQSIATGVGVHVHTHIRHIAHLRIW